MPYLKQVIGLTKTAAAIASTLLVAGARRVDSRRGPNASAGVRIMWSPRSSPDRLGHRHHLPLPIWALVGRADCQRRFGNSSHRLRLRQGNRFPSRLMGIEASGVRTWAWMGGMFPATRVSAGFSTATGWAALPAARVSDAAPLPAAFADLRGDRPVAAADPVCARPTASRQREVIGPCRAKGIRGPDRLSVPANRLAGAKTEKAGYPAFSIAAAACSAAGTAARHHPHQAEAGQQHRVGVRFRHRADFGVDGRNRHQTVAARREAFVKPSICSR